MKDWRHWAIFVLSALVVFLLFNECPRGATKRDTRIEDSLTAEIASLEHELAHLRSQQFALAEKSLTVEKKAKELPRIKDVVKPRSVIVSQPIEETADDYDSLAKVALKKEELLDSSMAIADSARKTLRINVGIDSLQAQTNRLLLAAKEAEIQRQKDIAEEERKRGTKKAIKASVITAAVTIIVMTVASFFKVDNGT
jgi:hypothetical protein